MLVDAHVHLWDPDALAYPWLDGFAPLRRPATPAGYAAAWGPDGRVPDALVHVQGDVRPDLALAEVDWVNAQEHVVPLAGIVAYAPLEDGAGVGEHLAELAARPRVVGVRRSTQNEPAGTFSAPGFRDGLRAAARAGLTVDVCCRGPQLAEVVSTVRDVLEDEPGLSVVLDHAGKPEIAAGGTPTWDADLRALAGLPGVTCKVSGLVTEADWESWSAAEVLDHARRALDAFGPSRTAFGSDWPVVTLASTLERWTGLVDALLAGLTPDERSDVLGGTAIRAYRL